MNIYSFLIQTFQNFFSAITLLLSHILVDGKVFRYTQWEILQTDIRHIILVTKGVGLDCVVKVVELASCSETGNSTHS